MAFAATGIGGLGEYGVETRNGFDVWDEDDDDVLEETELVGLIE